MPSWSAISPKAKAEAPTKSVKIQKMITAGSTHYTACGFGRPLLRASQHERGDQDARPEHQVARAVGTPERAAGRDHGESDPVTKPVEMRARRHRRVHRHAGPDRRDRGGDRHASAIGQD